MNRIISEAQLHSFAAQLIGAFLAFRDEGKTFVSGDSVGPFFEELPLSPTSNQNAGSFPVVDPDMPEGQVKIGDTLITNIGTRDNQNAGEVDYETFINGVEEFDWCDSDILRDIKSAIGTARWVNSTTQLPTVPQPVHGVPSEQRCKCPVCGSEEIDAMTARTIYDCGSSDYDARPGTFRQSDKCALILNRQEAK